MKTALKSAALFLAIGSSFTFPAGQSSTEVLAHSTTSWDGNSLKGVNLKNPEVHVLRIAIAPHSRLPIHKHPVINAGYLVKGKLTVVRLSDGKKLELKAGEALVEMVDEWHYGENKSDEPAEIIVVYAGDEGQAITVLKKEEP
ncbi:MULTISPECIES: cupin domain-containing protein [unclassified Endozoicomonas]|uniref:cupin domain-containing protein n=1 Tax=unclassified Endozoicomonas TaxID=2644528 RepID=UPI0021495CED|nr:MULTISPECIES: cupin domain-containing protein [unclassified Endozoicomonas]